MGVKAHRRRYKGFVPAAGLGTRLAPITDKIPKPLLPFFGPAVLDLALYKLTSAGLAVSDIAVNTHHLAEKIKHHIENHPCFSVVLLSVEQTILGTGGGLNALHDWIGDDDLIIYNGDIISNIDLAELIDFHETRSSLATLAVLPTALPGKNPLFCHNEKLLGIGERPSDKDITEHTFTGVHILSNTFLKKNIPLKDYWHITDTYRDTLARGGALNCFSHQGLWYDIGTPVDYFNTLAFFLDNPSRLLESQLGFQQLYKILHLHHNPIHVLPNQQTSQIRGPAFIAPDVFLDPTWRVEPKSIILCQPNQVKNLVFKNCMVFGSAKFEPASVIQDQIVYGKALSPVLLNSLNNE